MKNSDAELRLVLHARGDQQQRLEALQQVFAQACNALAPVVQATRCWNRVALHHLAYKQLRERFPELGSQMACNAIYSVSRTARMVYQHPASPFNLQRIGDGPLPQLQFSPRAPVYFDRHTLSIKAGEASLYTLDGRMRFALGLTPAQEQRFRDDKLREIVLLKVAGRYTLTFLFGEADAAADPEAAWPDYVRVRSQPQAEPQPFLPLAGVQAHQHARSSRPTAA